jgi:hypothetical protein
MSAGGPSAQGFRLRSADFAPQERISRAERGSREASQSASSRLSASTE